MRPLSSGFIHGLRRFVLLLCCLLISTFLLEARSYKLYLKDGDYQLVREHEIVGDRVRYYSVERSQWEEIPLELVDLDRTAREKEAIEKRQLKEAAVISELEAAQRALSQEASRVPMDHGVYLLQSQQVIPLKQARAVVETSKKRVFLQILTPVPLVAGKATVELEGEHSEFVIHTATPEFYIRLEGVERFMIVKAVKKNKNRVIQTWQIVPDTGQVFEEQEEVPTYKLQVAFNLYKFWPEKPLEPGEYAVIEYLPGQKNVEIWDFAYYPEQGSSSQSSSR